MPTRALHGLVPHLSVNGGVKAIDYYKAALGAVEINRTPDQQSGRLLHAELRIGNSTLFISDDFPEYNNGVSKAPKLDGMSPVTLHLDVPNVDAAVAQAVAAGASIKMPPMDMFWGDRYAQIMDPFGHVWSFATPLPQAG